MDSNSLKSLCFVLYSSLVSSIINTLVISALIPWHDSFNRDFLKWISQRTRGNYYSKTREDAWFLWSRKSSIDACGKDIDGNKCFKLDNTFECSNVSCFLLDALFFSSLFRDAYVLSDRALIRIFYKSADLYWLDTRAFSAMSTTFSNFNIRKLMNICELR